MSIKRRLLSSAQGRRSRTPDAAPPGAVGPAEHRPHKQVDVQRHVEEVRLLPVQRPVLALPEKACAQGRVAGRAVLFSFVIV